MNNIGKLFKVFILNEPFRQPGNQVPIWNIGESERTAPSNFVLTGTIGMVVNDKTASWSQWVVLIGEKKFHMNTNNIDVIDNE